MSILAEMKNKRIAVAYETNRGAVETTIVTLLDADEQFIKVMTRPDNNMELGNAITSYIAIKKIDSIIDVNDEKIYQRVMSKFIEQQKKMEEAIRAQAAARQANPKPEMKIMGKEE